jgi:AraC family transcriptional regulator, regulatory protein of adaptative response / DNA-3-methyladenine glycosylase II
VAYASGFQSLRRFNTAFRERYRLSPSDLRKTRREPRETRAMSESPDRDLVRLTLSYRAPFAWRDLLAFLSRDAIPGIESIVGDRYARTVRLGEQSGVVFVEDGASSIQRRDRLAPTHLHVDVTPSLVPTLMPLLARLRQLFDLDAEPTAIDGHLATSGLAVLVEQRPGLRIPGAFDGFEIVLRTLLGRRASRVASILGAPIDTGVDGLTHLSPTAERIAQAGAGRIAALGVNTRSAAQLTAVAMLCAAKTLRLEPGGDVTQMHRALLDMGLGDRAATTIVMRALYWPDAFPASDPVLQRAAGARNASDLLERAERWRPWRAYAAMYLRMHERDAARSPVTRSSHPRARRRRSLREHVHF